MPRAFLFSCLVCLLGATPARAQQQSPQPPPRAGATLIDLLNAKGLDIKSEGNTIRIVGRSEIPIGPNKFFADEIEIFTDTQLLVASGNVVFASPDGQIAAERVEFDVAAGTGTFHDAAGLMSLGATVDRAQFGNQDPDVWFAGQTIEKLGPKRYRITRGGFTTCVQPTPRWEVVATSMVLNLDDYAIARNMVLRVKGVPMMYLPLLYYPIQDDERATGFLLPTYGASTLRGQAISNAFFWAIGRSQDATFFHDWFTRAGQGAGGEYRYVASAQSSGNVRLYRFSQQEQQYSQDGVVRILPANTSFQVSGSAVHAISPGIRARARVDYFTDIVSQQLYQQNVYQASRRSRVIEAGVTAGIGRASASAFYQRNEVFNSAKSTQVYGSTPRVTVSLAPQRLFNAPVYASVNSDYAYLPYRSITDGLVTQDNSLNRLDVTPTVRIPLSRLTFLSLNTSATYRTTYYSRSLDGSQRQVPESYLRQYVSLRSDVIGPVFTRIWDLPDSGFAERLKHVIEPAFTVDITSRIEDYRRAPVLSDISDFVVGGTGRFTYGLTNRFFYRGRTVNGVRGQTREFITVGLQQTYYSNPVASQFDNTYQSAYGYRRELDLSPVALNVRVSPTAAVDANARVEYDVSGGGFQMLSTGGSLSMPVGSANLNYSRRQLDKTVPADNYLTASTSARWLQGRATGTYALSWDIGRSYVISQNVVASYMAQCCGLQFEFQRFNYPDAVDIPIPSDRRFNFGFVLAGLGTFSNFFGAFGGQ